MMSQFAGGAGTEQDPYQISDALQFAAMSNDLSAHYELINDIDLSTDFDAASTGGVGFPGIGDSGSGSNHFTGTFNGNEYTIYGLFINTSTYFVGLFNQINNEAIVENFTVEAADVTAAHNAGIAFGYLRSGAVMNVHTSGTLNVGSIGNGGGLGGYASGGNSGVSYSSSSASVTGTGAGSSNGVGGLMGKIQIGPMVEYSFATGSVSGTERVGGLIGQVTVGTIFNCYSWSAVTATADAGAFIGVINETGSNSSSIRTSYATGSIATGTGFIGRKIGSSSPEYLNNFFDNQTTGQSTGIGATGKTTLQMQQQSTYMNWNFNTVWNIDEGNDYPRLYRSYIIFDPLPLKTDDDLPFDLSATALLTDPITYSSSDPSVATISGETVTITGIGTTTITASQFDGMGNRLAGDAQQDLTVVSVFGCTGRTTYTISGGWDNGMPDNTLEAYIAEDYSTSSGSFSSCRLTIATDATLTVNPNEYVLVENDIVVNGNLIIEHQGSLVQVNDDAEVYSIGAINVNVTTPNLASRDFMILGSPLNAETRGNVYGSAFLVLDHTTINFVPNPDVAAQFPMAENFADDNHDNWNAYAGSITPAQGYIVRPQAGYGQPGGIFHFTHSLGALNNGVINFDVVYNTSKNDSPNVLSNPYPSAIDADAFIMSNSMVDEIYFWEHLTPPSPDLPGAGAMNFSMEDISMYNLMGGTAAAADPTGTDTVPNGVISTSQGFGIKANAAGTAIFNNSMRLVDGNTTLRNPRAQQRERIWLSISNNHYELQNTTLIGFTDSATEGLDPGYDSRRLATVVSLFSGIEGTTHELGIQSREAYHSGIKISVGFSTLIDHVTEYKISISQLEGDNLQNATVYLYDSELQILTNLTAQGAYSFSSSKYANPNRFTLLFESEQVLDIDAQALQQIVLFPNPATDVLQVVSPEAPIKRIVVVDTQGRIVKQWSVLNKESLTFSVTDLQSAVYFVFIETDGGQITKRLIKK